MNGRATRLVQMARDEIDLDNYGVDGRIPALQVIIETGMISKMLLRYIFASMIANSQLRIFVANRQ